jgi:GTP cyclohydrolase IA
MGALEDAHLAAVAAACEEEEDDDLELLAGEGDAIEPAVRALLAGLGEDERREGLRRTPKRVAKAFRDGTRGTRGSVPASVRVLVFQ